MATNKKRKNRGKGKGAKERRRRAHQHNAAIRERFRGGQSLDTMANLELLGAVGYLRKLRK